MTPPPQERTAATHPPVGPPPRAGAAVQQGPAPATPALDHAGPCVPPRGVMKLAAAMSEAELERQVRHIARDLGVLLYHTFDSRKSAPGFPDLVLVGKRVAYRELKKENGRVTAGQETWLAALVAAGQDACVWRPSDLLAGRIARKLAALAGVGAP